MSSIASVTSPEKSATEYRVDPAGKISTHPVSFQSIPSSIIALLATVVFRYPIKNNTLSTMGGSSRFNQHINIFDQAHTKMEALSGICLIAQLSKLQYTSLKDQTDKLRRDITQLCITAHELIEGPRFLREIVDKGYYLKVLRVYIHTKPEVIWNGVNTANNEGFQRTLLHTAVAPLSVFSFSTSFNLFLLETIQKKPNLSPILFHKDSYHNTVLQYHLSHHRFYDQQWRQRTILECPETNNPEGPDQVEQFLTSLMTQFSPPPSDLIWGEKIVDKAEESLISLDSTESSSPPAPTYPVPTPRLPAPIRPRLARPSRSPARTTPRLARPSRSPARTTPPPATPSRIKITFLKICSFIESGLVCVFRAIISPFTRLAQCFRSRQNAV